MQGMLHHACQHIVQEEKHDRCRHKNMLALLLLLNPIMLAVQSLCMWALYVCRMHLGSHEHWSLRPKEDLK